MQLHYRKYGEGPALIILHGLFGSSDNWHTLANRWSSTFTVYTVDLRNHGSSPHESVMTYEEMAQDVNQFLDQQNLDNATFIGHSMGGKVAMLYACNNPDRVSGLIILDIGIGRVVGQHGPILQVLRELYPQEYRNRSELKLELGKYISSPSIIQFLLKNIMRRVDGSFAWKFNHEALLDHYDDLTSALEIHDAYMGPSLFLRGEKSNYLREELSPEMLQYFPSAQLKTIENSGHWLHAEQPDQIFLQVKDFFS